jgi:hypothetical protein
LAALDKAGRAKNAGTVSGVGFGPEPSGCGAHAPRSFSEAASTVAAEIKPTKAETKRVGRISMESLPG